ncbi:hypothetical protein V491_00483 [Pseudogymnoascus sp. VKM F-3775]|nr:hypothetical protein V491_00483 [Pseudogymnoascus sp. VKM F-3775]
MFVTAFHGDSSEVPAALPENHPFHLPGLQLDSSCTSVSVRDLLYREQFDELRNAWEDDAWDDVMGDIEHARDSKRFPSDNDADWECDDTEKAVEDEDSDGDEDGDENGEEEDDDDAAEDGDMRADRSAENELVDQVGEDEDDEGSICDGREDQSNSNTDAQEVDKLAQLAFRLSIFLITKIFMEGQPSSSLLVYYSGILGCTADGSTFR